MTSRCSGTVSGRARLVGVVFLGASLGACFDSKRIMFIDEDELPDAAVAGSAPLEAQAAAFEGAAAMMDAGAASEPAAP